MTEEYVLVSSFWDGGYTDLLLLSGDSPGCLESSMEKSLDRSHRFECPHGGVHRSHLAPC